MSLRFSLLKARIREWFAFDSRVFAPGLRGLLGLLGVLFFRLGNQALSFRLMSRVHRTGSPSFVCRLIQSTIRKELDRTASQPAEALGSFLKEHIATAETRAPRPLAEDPERLINSLAIVVASAESGRGRGVIILKYNFAFPLFAKTFDLKAIAERYHIVLEPSWSGYCAEDILCYSHIRPQTVFVQATEQYDQQFLTALGANLVPVPISANWWVDHRLLSPDPTIEKDLDFVMVASWAEFKRHHRFFRALQKLRQNGHRLRGACVGYPAGLTVEDIQRRAEWYGVRDQIEFHESVPQSEVARLMNRAKVNVVWSRREGFNRVMIEGMFCDVPCLIPEGLNYGEKYAFVNNQTGRFSNEAKLPANLLEMTQAPWPHSPSEWVRNNMTPQHATTELTNAIENWCRSAGELPPEKLQTKVNDLGGMRYWNQYAAKHFAEDQEFLRSAVNARQTELVRLCSDT